MSVHRTAEDSYSHTHIHLNFLLLPHFTGKYILIISLFSPSTQYCEFEFVFNSNVYHQKLRLMQLINKCKMNRRIFLIGRIKWTMEKFTISILFFDVWYWCYCCCCRYHYSSAVLECRTTMVIGWKQFTYTRMFECTHIQTNENSGPERCIDECLCVWTAHRWFVCVFAFHMIFVCTLCSCDGVQCDVVRIGIACCGRVSFFGTTSNCVCSLECGPGRFEMHCILDVNFSLFFVVVV